MKNFVYGLQSPIDWKVYYVGCSKGDPLRPYMHYYSHNRKVADWVQSLGREPIVIILDRESEDLFESEGKWIETFIDRGEPLLNIYTPVQKALAIKNVNEDTKLYGIGQFLSKRRHAVNLSQEEFADKAGIDCSIVKKIEEGDQHLQFHSVLQALKMFGATLSVGRINSDQNDIYEETVD